jgi:D-amino peptidase
MMKVYISCDIEGVGCVVRPEHSTVAGRDYAMSRHFMTEEVNAAIRGAFHAGAAHVVVSDSHNVGLNLLPEELDERAELIMGTPRPLSMMEGVERGFDAVLFVGYHAKPGTADAVIAHNFHSRIRDTLLNHVSVGEIGMNAALAALYDVPVALVAGDAAAAAEAKALMPWVETVAVKRGIGAYAAQCLHPHVCRRRIYDGTVTALRNLHGMRPWKMAEPVVMELELTTASTADRLESVPLLNRVSAMNMRTEPVPLRTAYNIFLSASALVDMVPHI